MHSPLFPISKYLTTSVVLSASLLAACGGGSSDAPGSSFNEAAVEARSNQINGPLDPVQNSVVSDVIGGQLAANLPAPVGPGVSCLADALNSLVDGPDAVLAALQGLPSGADPAQALQSAAGHLTGSLQRFADELQAALAALSGQQANCTTVAAGARAADTSGNNPLSGTPLAALGDALAGLAGGVDGAAGNAEDPDLRAVAAALQSLLGNVEAGFSLIPAEVRTAPVVGSLLETIETTIVELRTTLPAIGAYDAPQTQAGLESLLNNLLDGVLTGVIPVEQIDQATGQNFSGQIRAGIDQATVLLGNGLGQLITPAFNQGLNGALEPVLDPVEGLLAQLLNGDSINGGNPLTGLLAGIAGNGASSPLDALLGLLTFGSSGNGLADLTAALSGNAGQSPLYQLADLANDNALPLDSLLGQLRAATANAPVLGDLLDQLLGEEGLLSGLLGSRS